MRKIIALWLTAVLLLGMVPVLAEQPGTEENAIPEAGQVVYGFEAVETREFPLLGAQVTLFEHQKTGAKLMYVANEDTNRAFQLTFNTRPIDNTGLPHVFEHATLQGSDRYPSKTLWFSLNYQTYNTYMNAYTTDAMTGYPIASLSEAQLLKLADFYTQDCFHPLVMEDESIYRREAWRYRLESPESELTLEGTVYSEMLGAMTLQNQAMLNANRAAFPGSSLTYEYGGDPDYIPEMTWESLKAYHDQYYHPSNCVAWLYGQFEDYTAFLALLDAEFSQYDRREMTEDTSAYTPITEPVVQTLGYPVEAGSSTENASDIWYYIVCPGMRENKEAERIMDQLCILLDASASPLTQNLKKALPSAQFSVGREVAAPDDAIGFYVTHVNPEDAEIFRQTVDESLREIAEKGFSQDLVDAQLAAKRISFSLVGEGSNVGVNALQQIAYNYATTGNPFEYMDSVKDLDYLDEWNREGVLSQAVSDWLLDRQTTALVATYPEPGKKEEKDEALRIRLAEIKGSMTEEELQTIVAVTNDPGEETDNSAMIASLQAVTVQSLPEEIREYEITDETGEDGVRRINVNAAVDGIGRVALSLDASGLPQELIHPFKLYTALMGDLDTSAHSWEELAVLCSRYLYSREIRIAVPDSDTEEGYTPMMRIGWIAADEDLSAGYDLMRELLLETQYTDTARLAERVSALKSALRSSINSGAYNVVLYRAWGIASPGTLYFSYAGDVDFYAYLERTEEALAADPESVVNDLLAVQDYFRKHGRNAVEGFSGNTESIALNRPLADAFLNGLGAEPVIRQKYNLPAASQTEALIVDSNVQYNLLYQDLESLGLADREAELKAVTTLVSDLFLIPLLRDQYGVYTPLAGTVEDEGIYLLTYRDPNILETFQVYEALPEMIKTQTLDQQTLDGYIMSAYVSYAQGSGELSGANAALLNAMQGKPQDRALEAMRSLKALTPEAVLAYADMYQQMVEEGIRMTAGGAGMIQNNADLYENILNPFGVEDAAQQELTDAPEGSDHYEAVRFAYENGLMSAAEENLFGTEKPATVGDLLGALTVAVGAGGNDPAEAIAFWAEMGLVPEETEAEMPLTQAAYSGIMNPFASMVGIEAPAAQTDGDAPITRGMLAEILMKLLEE